MSSQVVANIKIHNRSYKVKVSAEDEHFLRSHAEKVNEKISEYMNKFKGRDMQDYLSLCLIAQITESHAENEKFDVQEIIDEINDLAHLIK